MGPLSSNPWTSGQFVQMSQSLAQAYGNTASSSTNRRVQWTPERLVNFSAAMACLLK